MNFFTPLPSVIRIYPPRNVVVWWNGMPHQELITFDDAGYKLMFHSLGGNLDLPDDVVRNNIREYLNDLLSNSNYNFNQGRIHLDEPKVKAILGIK